MLNEVYPSKEYIAIKFADLNPSLKNFKPIPGATVVASGALAADNLTYPFYAPFNIPVYGCWPFETNYTLAVTDTVWINFFLSKALNGPYFGN